jgi:hypothetical protein
MSETPELQFCHWLKGYLGAIKGRDELDAFEANAIRAQLADTLNGSLISPRAVGSAQGTGGQDIVGVLRSVHSALDSALGDTDVTHIENDDDLRQEHPVHTGRECSCPGPSRGREGDRKPSPSGGDRFHDLRAARVRPLRRLLRCVPSHRQAVGPIDGANVRRGRQVSEIALHQSLLRPPRTSFTRAMATTASTTG